MALPERDANADPSNDANSTWRVRRFTYDSLSRLLTARNPESGLITYQYDNGGNLLSKTNSAANQRLKGYSNWRI